MTELERRANDWHQTTGLPINPNLKETPMADQKCPDCDTIYQKNTHHNCTEQQQRHLAESTELKERVRRDKQAALHDRVEHDITNHPPVGPHVVAAFEAVAAAVKQYMHTVVDIVPAGREQSLALTLAEQSIQMARAGIARNQDQVPDAIPRPSVADAMRAAGWSENMIGAAMDARYTADPDMDQENR